MGGKVSRKGGTVRGGKGGWGGGEKVEGVGRGE